MTVLDIRSVVLSIPRRGPLNPLPPLRLLGDLHDDIDFAGLDEEMARNMRYGRVSSVLPYLLQDDYSRELVPQETRVAMLENSYLRATVLLEFGGRLWSLEDKVGGRALLYNNDRIQLGNLGLRNAWFPGGVEWNLGTTGHTALTCSPVHAASFELPDGSPGLRIYEWERIRDLVYQVDFRLGPSSRHLAVDVRVTNPNARTVPAYWWSNIAVASSAGTRWWCPVVPRSSSPMREGSVASRCRDPAGSTSAIRRRRLGPPTTSSSWTAGSSLGSRPSTRQASACCTCPAHGFMDGSCSPGGILRAGVAGRSS